MEGGLSRMCQSLNTKYVGENVIQNLIRRILLKHFTTFLKRHSHIAQAGSKFAI